jgi:hypothetical protein
MKTISPTTWHGWMKRLAGPTSLRRINQPFRVVGETMTAVGFGAGRSSSRVRVRQYDLQVPYLTVRGRARTGMARLFVPRDTKGPMALIAVMHYELGLDGAAEYLAQGWAVMTPRETLNPFADGVNFNLALVQACRQIPFVDVQRIALVGGSAGGYVTLMVASETFPIAAAAPLAPLVSIPYNVEYFARNIAPARCGAKDQEGNDASYAPTFCAVAEALIGFSAFLGPLADCWQAWLRNSPVGRMNLVTCPVLATFSTADILVPVNQVSERFAVRPASGTFPQGFEFGRRALVAVPVAQRTFMQVVGRRSQVFRLRVPDNVTRLWETAEAGPPPAWHDMPCVFSKSQPVSVVIFDEGAPDPRLGHFKYCLRYSMVPFLRHWLRRKTPLAPEQLTARKLGLLMRRFCGADDDAVVECEERGRPATLLRRRNTMAREKMDVVAGLRAYWESGPAHRKRLRSLYRKLPASLRALDVGAARFDQDIAGGLAYHEAMLQRSFGDVARARALAQELLSQSAHAAFAASLPLRLRHTARKRLP